MVCDESNPDENLRRLLVRLSQSAKSRAKARGLEIAPDLTGIVIGQYRENKGRCALTGLKFDLRQVGQGAARRPFAPSIDRVDSSSGYTRDNVRLVCQSVNFALNAYGEDTFYEVAAAATRYRGCVPDPIAEDDGQDEGKRKRRYIEYVATQTPKLLETHGGRMAKAELRGLLRTAYGGSLPADEANAYGWAFRRLMEQGVLEPSSGSAEYRLRRGGRLW
ncbi:MAG: hypothetical protein Kilf2KO_11730 [Rhodospirillales bacterium]